MARKRLGEILLAAGVISETQLRGALAEQRRWGGHLGRIMVDMGILSEQVLVQALSRQLNIPAVALDKRSVSADVIDLLPGDFCEQHGCFPFHVDGKFLDVAMIDPTNLGVADEVRIRTQLNVHPFLAGPKSIERALARYYGRGALAMTMSYASDSNRGLQPNDDAIELATTALDHERSARPVEMTAAQRRAHGMSLSAVEEGGKQAVSAAEIANLQERIAKLEALLARDENVIRKLMALLIEKGLATREEMLERIK